jgi:hypothetical protein
METIGTRLRELADWREWARGLAIAAAAGLFLSFSGAFGSGMAPLGLRTGYWVGLMVGGALWGRLAGGLVFGVRSYEGRTLVQALVMTPLIATPLVAVVWFCTSLVFGFPLRLETLPGFIGPVFLVAAAMTTINLMAGRRPRETHAAPAGASPPKFLDRLPLKLRGAEIWAVEAEDHYLRIHTDRGSDLILMRLSDAIGELEGIEGAQTHRSWWVAKGAVVEASRGDGRATFTLRNGVKAPVSRTYARALRAEGWY